MAYHRQVAVIGSAIAAPLDRPDRSLEELIYEVTQKALADAGLTIEAIDGIVVASNDQFDGRAISVMAASGSVGGVDRDILSTPSAAEHAFVMGALRVASGQYRTQLVVAWSPTEASSLSEAQRLGADPYFHRALPLDELSSHALQATALLRARPELETLADAVVAKNRQHAALAYPQASAARGKAKPARWPLREGMVAGDATGVVALVLASAAFVEEEAAQAPAWIEGMGWTTEAGFLGDRDLSQAAALQVAARQAYRAAGVTDPKSAFDVAEVSDQTPYQELMAYEALGLADAGELAEKLASGAFARGGRLPVNPSGGAIAVNPVFCAGLIRIAEAARQVAGRAGPHQVEPARRALAHAASGFAMQYQTVVVLGAEKRVTS